jgi:putative sterol carrier protein
MTSPHEYFTRIVPQQYAAAIAAAPGNVVDQPPLSVTYIITGEQGSTYGLRTEGATLDVAPGGVDGADMVVTQSYEDWARSIETGASEMFVDYVARRKVAVVKGLKGTVNLALTRSDGSLHETSVVFGGQSEPAVTIMMTTEDYRDMMSGELNGNMAFMMGKLKFEGSLPLLMQIGALSG